MVPVPSLSRATDTSKNWGFQSVHPFLPSFASTPLPSPRHPLEARENTDTGQHNISVNSALFPLMVAKSSTSFGWGKGVKVTAAGWQVTLCDPIWHVISRSGVVTSITNCYIRFILLYSAVKNNPPMSEW